MPASRRPYLSLSIADLEARFTAQSTDVSFLSELIAELSSRNTRRARLLLEEATRTLAEREADDLSEADAPDIEAKYEEDWRARQRDPAAAALNDGYGGPDKSTIKQNTPGSDQPPDDRR